MIGYAWLTGIIGYAIIDFGVPDWFSILVMLAGIAIFGWIGMFGLSVGYSLAEVKGSGKRSKVYMALVAYLLLMAIVSFVFSLYFGERRLLF